jgi:hypothetical protein
VLTPVDRSHPLREYVPFLMQTLEKDELEERFMEIRKEEEQENE